MLLSVYLLVLAGLVHALAPKAKSSGLTPRNSDSDSDSESDSDSDPVFKEFKFVGCEVEELDLVQASFSHVQDMVRNILQTHQKRTTRS